MEQQETKKQNKKKWLIILAFIAIIVAAIAGVGIWAYLTDTESATNIFTVGKVDITLTEPRWDEDNAKNITAKSKIAKDPTVTNVGANDAYVYLKVKVPKVTLKDGDTSKVPLFTYQVNAGWSELEGKTVDADSYIEKVYYYNQNDGILAKNGVTPALFNEVQVANITSDTTYTTDSGETKRLVEATNYSLEQAIDINAYAIQTNNLPEGRNTVQTAYDVVANGKEDDVPVTKIGGKTLEEIKAENNGSLASLYGKQVRYGEDNSKTWRIFYIEDSSNTFGDGEGTIYLKADWTANDVSLNSALSSYTLKDSYPILQQMNKQWAAADGGTISITGDSAINKRASAWLCDKDVWTSQYSDNTKSDYINYVIGSPSAEMYIKSYNEAGIDTNVYKCRYAESGVGYEYSWDNGTNWATYTYNNGNNPLAAGQGNMYLTPNPGTSQWWWLASPSASHSDCVCLVDGYGRHLNYDAVYETAGVCPVVSLKSGVQLELVD